jgi:hypothetical protein
MTTTTIIGAGPVGLSTALTAARRGRVRVVAPGRARNTLAYRIDVVPVALLALLVELGVHPTRLGITESHDFRLAAWESREPKIILGAATAHVMRPRLEEELLEQARRHSNIVFLEQGVSACAPQAGRCLDASGRAAISARERIVPDNPAMCRVYAVQGAFSKAQQAFRIASTPFGYVYRSGGPDAMALGVVQGRSEWATPLLDLDHYLRGVGAGWLIAGLDVNSMVPAGGGFACAQVAIGSNNNSVLIGDAAFARDPLSAQGIANGISDGLKTLDEGGTLNRDAEISSHIHNLRQMIATCRYEESPYWRRQAAGLDAFERRVAAARSLEETSSDNDILCQD